MALRGKKKVLTPRGSVKNHIFNGIGTVKELLHSMDNVLVHFDPDVDGVIAGYLICKFLSKHGKSYMWYINSNRSHDWNIPIEKVSGKDIIAVDFIITAEKLAELVKAGCNVISIDHHDNGDKLIHYEIECNKGIIINNQNADEDDDSRYLSGAGVVFETLISIDKEFDTELNRCLVGITLLSDVRDIENEYARGYLYKLYSAKYTGFLRYLIDATMGKDYSFGLPRMDRNYIDYKFSPAINACLRFNQEDSVVNFILGTGNINLVWRDEQKKFVEELMSAIKVIELNHISVGYIYEDDFVHRLDILSNFIGLCASKLLGNNRSSICYVIAEERGERFIRRASFRGNINGLDYNKQISEYLDCRGHGSAFGIVGMRPNKLLFVKTDRICGALEKESGYVKPVIDVVNLSLFVNNRAFEIAEDNMYRLSQNQTRVRYTGRNVSITREGKKFREYSIDGISVMSFDLKSNPAKNLILPVLDRGILTFYLE